ncbi:hypothetical protein MSPP1_002633 [Malassezia sp. CBS 17886]|nr:hypothetical protein MSPP1_002633 [Malassezia sp. CBS 17886]
MTHTPDTHTEGRGRRAGVHVAAPPPPPPAAGGSAGIFEIALRADAASFQSGYLGVEGATAWVVGDVLTKLESPGMRTAEYTGCTVSLAAEERVGGANGTSIELYAAAQRVWEAHADRDGRPAPVPGVLPFHFQLADDTPQCIHLSTSELCYSVTARLHGRNGNDLVASLPLHPTRYTRAGWDALQPYENTDAASENGEHRPALLSDDAEYSLSPRTWSESDPIDVHFWIERTVVRRTDPIQIQVHVPPPDAAIVTERGWQLQSVEATLVRVIQSHPSGQLHSDWGVLQRIFETAVDDTRRDGGTGSAASRAAGAQAGGLVGAADAAGPLPALAPRVHQTVMAHSGKSCRFHSKRPIHLRLALHPSSSLGLQRESGADFGFLATRHGLGDGACESITQDTTLHKVRFALSVRVVIRDAAGAHHDIITGQLIRILPGPEPGAPPPPPHAAADTPPAKGKFGKKRLSESAQVSAFFEDQSEYDGYDDASQGRGMVQHGPATLPEAPGDTAVSQPAPTFTDSPPPSIHAHVNDTRLPDDMPYSRPFALQLDGLPPSVVSTMSEERLAAYGPASYEVEVHEGHEMDAGAAPFALRAATLPLDHPPGFDEAANATDARSHFRVHNGAQEYGMLSAHAASPQLARAGAALTPSLEERETLPSYADSAPALSRARAEATTEDANPPAYVSTLGAREAGPRVVRTGSLSSPAQDEGTVFPPLYEA